MKRRIIVTVLVLAAMFLVSGVNGGTVNDQSKATFVVR